MGEAKVGEEFITHEFDEAIAVQQTIVDAERRLSGTHPRREAAQALRQTMREDERFLKELQAMGRRHDATGKVEDVAGGLKELMEETVQKATTEGAPSDYYEAHAVLLNLKRKQQDSATAMVRIARAMRDTKMRDAAMEFRKAQTASCRSLGSELAAFAVTIARP